MAATKYKLLALVGATFLVTSPLAFSGDTARRQCSSTGTEIAGLMVKTKVVAVTNYSGDAREFKADADPETLELVLLPRKKGATSHTSDDGEVIFLYGNVRGKEQSRLIELAYCLRAEARRGA